MVAGASSPDGATSKLVRVHVNGKRMRATALPMRSDLRARFPGDASAGVAYHVEPMKQYLVANVRTTLLALMGAVLFVLLIACGDGSERGRCGRSIEELHEYPIRVRTERRCALAGNRTCQ